MEIEKNTWEMRIPGLPEYTIDGDLNVRSYARPGAPVLMALRKRHRGDEVYVLNYFDEFGLRHRQDFTPLRLYYCAINDVCPLYYIIKDFTVDAEGKMKIKGRKRKVKFVERQITPEEQRRNTAELQQMRLREYQLDVEAQLKAVKDGEWDDVLLRMYYYRPVATLYMMGALHCNRIRANDVFSEAVHRVLQSMKDNHRAFANILYKIICEMKIMIAKKEQV